MVVKNFCLALTFILAISFLIHLSFLKFIGDNLWDHLIIESYIFNGIATGIIYYFLIYNIKQKSIYISWFFLLGTIIKFSFFFIFFYPSFSADEFIAKTEFFSFFIPYLVSLTFETISLIKLLKKF